MKGWAVWNKSARFPHSRPRGAESKHVMQQRTEQASDESLYQDLQAQTERFANEIDGPTISKTEIVDRLLDLRNLGHGRDLGLELTVDEMLQSVPGRRVVSSEWWMSCLSDLADHAAFLAAGYPAASPELVSA